MPTDGLSRIHFTTVRAEIEGRFFSQDEADALKGMIDHRTITNLKTRAIAAQAWNTEVQENGKRN